MLSDLELIEEFIKDSYRGRDVLLANHVLRAQQISGQNQLMSKTEGVLLKINVQETPPQFLVKTGSTHWELIAQTLANQQFICGDQSGHNGYYPFCYCRLPKGYQLNCTKSMMLWRSWWKYRQRIAKLGLSSELWIRSRETWYPIRNVICSQGFIFIQTLGSEISLHSEDLVTWLSKTAAKPTAEN